MCKGIQDWLDESKAEGKAEAICIIRSMVLKGMRVSQIAEVTSLPLEYLADIAELINSHPEWTDQQIAEKLMKEEAVLQKSMYGFEEATSDVVQETSAYKVDTARSQGDFTTEDYYRISEEKRVELIDGVVYDMSSPSFVHQRISSIVYMQIANFIESRGGNCIPVLAPMDVKLGDDDRTMLQPDVFIVCDQNKIRKWGILGAPDFILEVLSPETKRKDCMQKLQKYIQTGVKEYWMIDPDLKKLLVYDFEQDSWPKIYELCGKLEVAIFDGALKIDLDKIAAVIQQWPEN